MESGLRQCATGALYCFLFTSMTYLQLLNIHRFVLLHADDTLMYCCGTDLSVVQAQFQQDAERVQGWMQSNQLQLSVAKSALMLIGPHQKLKDHSVSISIGGRPLPRVISTRLSGCDY